jgi:predicted DNA-binding transcriptional regulator YafY
MSHPTTRVLTLLELLQAHPRLTGTELADRLGVDERTVRRYTARLVELGIPVQAERGRHGGYRLLPGFKLPPLMLTDDEATAVLLGLLAGQQLGLTVAGPGADSALAKIQRVLPAALRERTNAVAQTLDFTAPRRLAEPPGSTAPAGSVVLTLADAARRHRRVRLAYRSWRGEHTDRDLDPYGLVFHSGRWYVTGLDQLRGEIRTFRVDRVRAARPLDVTFEGPSDEFDPVEHVTRSLAGVRYQWPVEVWLQTSMAQAGRRIPPSVARLTEFGGGVLLRAHAERLDGMARLLAGLEWPFVIRRPDELRTALHEHAQRLAAASSATEIGDWTG